MIYGGVGLGKTHLIQAIGNSIVSQDSTKRIRYVYAETFTNEYIDAQISKRLNEFSALYRSMDVLIVDDIQFFSGTRKIQDTFFYVFNELHQHGCQIILSADRAPKDIEAIEERLLSRFVWGFTAELGAPDLETRQAIIIRKAPTRILSCART